MKRKWTRASAAAYIQRVKDKGLTYWSAYDYLKKVGTHNEEKRQMLFVVQAQNCLH